jgi:5-(aminomethyl)-3-furanmethanol phosphate kinase
MTRRRDDGTFGRPAVVKVGGSLFDLPDLGPRLRRWLDENAPPEVLLVPGGGPAADVVRALDRTHGLGEEAAHWLALRALAVNAALLAALLPAACVIDGPDLAELVWEQGRLPVLDAFAFCEADEADAGHLPHTWVVTSDSLAARAAVVAGAAELVLLKSAEPPGDARTWAAAGYVDAHLPQVLAGTGVRLKAVNFRSDHV